MGVETIESIAVGLFFIKYPGNPQISSEKVDKYNTGEAYGEGYIKDSVYDYGEDKSIQECFYIRKYPWERCIFKKSSRKIEPHNHTTDYVCHE